MSIFSGTGRTSNLTEILRTIVDTNQTGYLKMKEGAKEGFLAVENGVIINAQTGSHTALPALFQFVGWGDASIEFHERPIPANLPRDLAVYDPEVLITGVAFKVDELNLLQQAMPPLDSIPYYTGREARTAFEATPADLGLLALADGHRSVREIAEKVMLSPLEVARSLARFRLAGVLDLLKPRAASPGPKMAATG